MGGRVPTRPDPPRHLLPERWVIFGWPFSFRHTWTVPDVGQKANASWRGTLAHAGLGLNTGECSFARIWTSVVNLLRRITCG
jgi:hypothetical protein